VTRATALRLLLVTGVIVLVMAAPLVLSGFAVSILTLVLVAALLASSVNMLVGQVGLLSIGHAGIAASAAYAVAWATVRGYDLPVQLALAALLTLGVSTVYGLTTMRTRGIVFLMITLALGMIIYGLAFRLTTITGGQNGLTGITRPAVVGEASNFYLLSAVVLALVLAGLWILSRSPFGLTLRGVRDSESRMASLGYSVASIKFAAVMVSGMIAGLAGVLAVWHAQFMSPAAATFGRSALAVVMVILGGAGTLLGPLVGAAIVVGAEHWLSSYVERWSALLGLVFILAILFVPRGVVGGLAALADRFARRPGDLSVSPASAIDGGSIASVSDKQKGGER
jgi:branched-chain amino acid transport system permease protein